jgi:hypothetical protein
MRKFFAALIVAVFLTASPFSPVACTSTQTATAQTTAFQALQTIRVSVESAVKVFNVGYQSGQYTDAQRLQLGLLYNKYLAADTVAAQALTVSTSDSTTIVGNITQLAAAVLNFVQTLQGVKP